MHTSYTLTLHATVCRLWNLDAIRRQVWTADEVAADAPPSRRAGALCAAIVDKVRVSLWYFTILEASIDTVVVLVTFACASFLQAGSTTGASLQCFFNTVFQLGTVDTCAVTLAQTHAQVEKKESAPQQSGSRYNKTSHGAKVCVQQWKEVRYQPFVCLQGLSHSLPMTSNCTLQRRGQRSETGRLTSQTKADRHLALQLSSRESNFYSAIVVLILRLCEPH